MELMAFAKQRPATNLLSDEKYTLPVKQTKTGFLGVFTKRYGGDPRKNLLKVALGALMDTRSIPVGRPPRPTNEEEKAKMKEAKALLKVWEDERAKTLFRFTELKKVNGSDPYFRINLPIALLPHYQSLQSLVSLFTVAPVSPDVLNELRTFTENSADQLFPPQLAISNSGVATDLQALLKDCLLGVRYKSAGGRCLISLEFKCTHEESEHLVSMDWMDIRPVDMFPLMSMWAAAEYLPKFYGKTATSVSKIAETLPPHSAEDMRVDQYGIAIGLDGKPIFLPKECNNTQKYESMYTNIGSNPDGTFSLGSLDETIAKAKLQLPANIPVLVDWVNSKFSYTNTQGRIEVMPLEHVRKCTASMARNLLGKRISFSQLANWEGYAARSNVMFGCASLITEKDLEELNNNDPYYWARPILEKAMRTNQNFKSVMIEFETEFKQGRPMAGYPNAMEFTSDGSEAFQFIRRFVQALYNGMLNNLDALYVQYAVSTITENLGWISLLATYGANMAVTHAEANTSNQAAANQGVDPDWKVPEAPLITKKFTEETGGMLPHQAKVRNLLKDSPDFAVLSVAAGGGKSMLSITDVLYEVKANRSAPYLIMCPSHLVANYVSEIVEFTDGGVNVIPITSYNIRTTGYARYEQILEVAPINTIIVVDYDALKFRAKSAVYGTSAIAIYPVIEMLRKFKPGYCMMDESHMLKNTASARFKSVMSLVADIPKKRIASGTLNPDSPSDLAGQMAILDPTIFGTKEEFNAMFAKGEYKGGRVTEWQDNAGAVALSMIKRNCVWAEAKRKEWACALPNREDYFLSVELTPAQKEIYDALFDEMVLSIRKKAETDKKAQKLLDKLSGKKATKTDEEDFGDMAEEAPEGEESEEDLLDDEGDIGAGLQPYLAAIEQFVSDPASHPYAKDGWVDAEGNRHAPLSGSDLLAPKTQILVQRLKQWFGKYKAKAIVFTNYQNTAESIFNSMPPELRNSGILYRASEKTETINRFKKDPNIKWLIGIRKSMEVGLNLQAAGYLARIEGCWTPGEQEQGDSRIARPFFGKGGDQREVLWFDTFVADKTFDVTKAARLRAKIVALAKFENAKDPNYQNIENIPVFPMTLENIQTRNDFATNVRQYAESIAQLNSVIKAEYAEYREILESEGGFKFTQIPKAAVPPEARLLARVPYAQGTELYSANELGLVRVDNFLGTEMGAEDEEEDDTDEDDSTPANSVLEAQKKLLVGMRCHTEHGEGEIIGAGAPKTSPYITRLRVRLDDGSTVNRLRSTNVFVVTRSETNSIDMRNKLAKAAGLDVTAPVTVPAVFVKPGRVTQKMLREQERKKQEDEKAQREKDKASRNKKQISVALHLSVVNGYMRLGFDPGKNSSASKALEAVGFKMEQPYVRTLIRSHKHLISQAQLWASEGFNVTSDNENETFRLLTNELATKALQTHRHYVKTVGAANFQNYLRKMWKPTADKKALHLFALVTNGGSSETALINKAAKLGQEPAYGAAYLCMPYGAGFPATKNAMRYLVTGTRWVIKQGELSMFVNSTAAVKQIMLNMRDAGITVSNIDEIREQAKSARRVASIGGLKEDSLDLAIKEEDEAPAKPGRSAPAKPTKPVRR